jgi:hypothetical protein
MLNNRLWLIKCRPLCEEKIYLVEAYTAAKAVEIVVGRLCTMAEITSNITSVERLFVDDFFK